MGPRPWLAQARSRVGLTQEDLAEALAVAPRTVSRWETGESTPRARQRGSLAAALHIPLDRLACLDAPTEAAHHAPAGTTHGSASPPMTRAPRSPDWWPATPGDNGAVHRRTFVALSGTAAFGALLSGAAGRTDGLDALATVFSSYSDPAGTPDVDVQALPDAVAAAKRAYQACRYSSLTRSLPGLIDSVRAACAAAAGDDQRRRAETMSADVHHVAASLLLKHGDSGMAWIAADRSMRAARRTYDPAMIASSARIVVHALMSNHRYTSAATTGTSIAETLARELRGRPSPELLSVYGALLLRSAIAAARGGDRDTANTLLDKADQVATRLGGDHNLRWTAFGPTNVRQHRVNVAVTFADAGTAIDGARHIDLDRIPIVERKAALLIDTARAFTQWGRHEPAIRLLHAADHLAHDELTTRPEVHRMMADLAATAPTSAARDIRDLAEHAGATL